MPTVTDQFDTLEIAISGAAPLGKELQHAASAKLGKGDTFISQTWGLSETTGSVTVMPVRLFALKTFILNKLDGEVLTPIRVVGT